MANAENKVSEKKEKSLIDPIYEKFVKSVIRSIGSTEFYEFFMDSISRAENEFQFSNRKMVKTVDLSWVDAIEETLEAMQAIITNPRNVIREEELIVNVSNAKKSGSETVRHLAQHSALVDDFNEEKIAEWEASGPDEDHRDAAIDLLRRRAAVTLFRASQVCYALENNRETNIGREMARWFANEAFLNQYIMFADAINDSNRANDAIQRKQDLAASRVARNDALSRLLRELPNEFTIDDMKMLTAEKGMASSTAYVYVKRMIDRELIMDDGEKYRKLDAEEM